MPQTTAAERAIIWQKQAVPPKTGQLSGKMRHIVVDIAADRLICGHYCHKLTARRRRASVCLSRFPFLFTWFSTVFRSTTQVRGNYCEYGKTSIDRSSPPNCIYRPALAVDLTQGQQVWREALAPSRYHGNPQILDGRLEVQMGRVRTFWDAPVDVGRPRNP